MDAVQLETLAVLKGVASDTDLIVDSSLPSALLPEAGTTEEKAHVTCVHQQQRTEDLLLLVLSTLLTLIKRFCI